MNTTVRSFIAAWCVLAALYIAPVNAQPGSMSFFVTSVGLGKGGDLGGLEGADRHCRALAQAAGAGSKTWRAYLSTQGTNAVNARDRIGRGPWTNAKGVVIAKNVDQLHGANNLTKQTALTEKGDIVNGVSPQCLSNLRRGVPCEVEDPPIVHDLLTGTQPDGTAFGVGEEMTCGNWTRSGTGAAMVGHSDRTGLDESAAMTSWNSSHPSQGCSQEDLRGTGGNGLFYCFATE